MMAESMSGDTGKGRKRVALKAATRQSVHKVKSTIHLSVEASQRLDIHGTMMGLDRSALVEKLVNDHLRRAPAKTPSNAKLHKSLKHEIAQTETVTSLPLVNGS